MADIFRDVGTVAAAIVAILGCVALVSKLPPVRWVFRNLVSDPASEWFRAAVREEVKAATADILTQVRPNGGSSMNDQARTAAVVGVRVDKRVQAIEQNVRLIQEHLGIDPTEDTP
jgi:hypothetical protein